VFASLVAAACGKVASDKPDAQIDAASPDAVPDSYPDLPLPSCTGLPATCGASGNGDCCTSPLVPGGTYARSYDVSGDGMYASSSQGATVSEFRLDTYEVTVGRFRRFVASGQGTLANPPLAGAGAPGFITGDSQGLEVEPEWEPLGVAG
jgi:hypothetical protein